MKIGIDASRAFLKKRTGIEEYSYQVIKHLRDVLSKDAEVVLYVRKKLAIKNWQLKICTPDIDFELPPNWRVKGLWAPRLWTQVRLSIEMLLHRPEVLFVPAHTVPIIHPKQTIVTIHGLEYEFVPESYSWYERIYMRFSIRNSVRWAEKVIAVSENTKHDLVRLYGVSKEKINVVYEGVNWYQGLDAKYSMLDTKYFLFIGRVEERKNVIRIIEAFELFKQQTNLSHKLVLAGKPGYGYEKIRDKIRGTTYRRDIAELGYIEEGEKWELLKWAEALMFPSLYEGFGLPVLEAQMVGTPVITSNTSSLPEIAGKGALLVDPLSAEALSDALRQIVMDKELRAGIIDKATQNVDRFSWAHCAQEVAQILLAPKVVSK